MSSSDPTKQSAGLDSLLSSTAVSISVHPVISIIQLYYIILYYIILYYIILYYIILYYIILYYIILYCIILYCIVLYCVILNRLSIGCDPSSLPLLSVVNGGELVGNTGQIASPLYPQPYPDNIEYIWTIIVDQGKKVRIDFTVMDIEANDCAYDYIQVRGIPRSSMDPVFSMTEGRITLWMSALPLMDTEPLTRSLTHLFCLHSNPVLIP